MNKAVYFAIILLFFSCSNDNRSVPNEFLQPEKMSDILVDFSLLEGMMRSEVISGDSAVRTSPYLYEQVFVKHQVSRQEFKTSMDYYTLHPEKLDPVYEKVLEKLSKMESDLK